MPIGALIQPHPLGSLATPSGRAKRTPARNPRTRFRVLPHPKREQDPPKRVYHRYGEPVGRAAAACGMAQQCVRLSKWDGGCEWLRMAAAESFRYAHRASLSRDFDHYEGEPWFDALRRGEEGPVLGPSGSRPDPSIQ